MEGKWSDGDNDKEMKGIVKGVIKKRRREGSNEGVEEIMS